MEAELEAFLLYQLQACQEDAGCLGMGMVRQVVPTLQETRSARLQIHVDVERELLGKLPRQLQFLCFGRTGAVTVGQRLLFAVGLNSQDVHRANLRDFVEVPSGMEEEVIRLHQQEVDKTARERIAGSKQVETIKYSVLRDCLNSEGCVALARVVRLEPIHEETRGAQVIIHLEVEQHLLGEFPREVNYRVDGSPDLVKLSPRLMIAAYPPWTGTDDIEMASVVGVPKGQESKSVQAHQQALAKVGKSLAPSGR
jgi:hypothetical protein